ncbi:MAG TPA: anti-sigma factor [Saprospiraceae bacterium]|nr:anti-sigma factor [Saprospiraceae bacterium]
MDVKKYIESGIIEAYCLQQTAEKETREVECLSKIYPEIQERIYAFNEELHELSAKMAISPIPSLKAKIFEEIDRIPKMRIEKNENEASVKQVNTNWLAAASALLLLGLGFLLYQFSHLQGDYQQLAKSSAEIQERNNDLRSQIEQSQEQLAFLTHSATQEWVLSDPNQADLIKAIVYWNPNNQKYFLTAESLSDPDPRSQYQVWAIIGDQPVSIGLIEPGEKFIALSHIELSDIDAFGITMEKMGGSKQPTMSQLKAIGTSG